MPIYFSSKLKSVCRVKEVKDSLFKVYNVVFLWWRMMPSIDDCGELELTQG